MRGTGNDSFIQSKKGFTRQKSKFYNEELPAIQKAAHTLQSLVYVLKVPRTIAIWETLLKFLYI